MAGAFMLGTQGCQRQSWDTNPEHMLRLSTDTLFFDTVFATVGSVTLPLKLYNDHDASLRVEGMCVAISRKRKECSQDGRIAPREAQRERERP